VVQPRNSDVRTDALLQGDLLLDVFRHWNDRASLLVSSGCASGMIQDALAVPRDSGLWYG
jgi:hypothetical protein